MLLLTSWLLDQCDTGASPACLFPLEDSEKSSSNDWLGCLVFLSIASVEQKSWSKGQEGTLWPQERGRTRGNQAGQVPSTQLSPLRGLLSQGCPSHRGATLKAHRYYFPVHFSVMSYLLEVEFLLTSSEVICEVLDSKSESWKRTLHSQPVIHFQHKAGFAIKPLLFWWTLIFPSSKMLFPKLL